MMAAWFALVYCCAQTCTAKARAVAKVPSNDDAHDECRGPKNARPLDPRYSQNRNAKSREQLGSGNLNQGQRPGRIAHAVVTDADHVQREEESTGQDQEIAAVQGARDQKAARPENKDRQRMPPAPPTQTHNGHAARSKERQQYRHQDNRKAGDGGGFGVAWFGRGPPSGMRSRQTCNSP